jgi:hypothetical protein
MPSQLSDDKRTRYPFYRYGLCASAQCIRAGKRSSSCPIRSLARPFNLHSSELERGCFNRGERAGLLTSESSPAPPFQPSRESGISGAFVVRYSGATVRDSHPVPYSPAAVTTGTLSQTGPQYFVDLSKNYARYCVFCKDCQAGIFKPKELRTNWLRRPTPHQRRVDLELLF